MRGLRALIFLAGSTGHCPGWPLLVTSAEPCTKPAMSDPYPGRNPKPKRHRDDFPPDYGVCLSAPVQNEKYFAIYPVTKILPKRVPTNPNELKASNAASASARSYGFTRLRMLQHLLSLGLCSYLTSLDLVSDLVYVGRGDCEPKLCSSQLRAASRRHTNTRSPMTFASQRRHRFVYRRVKITTGCR
jgi:hypothetical protein